MNITTKSISKNEFLELIEFDKIHFYQSMEKLNLPVAMLPPLYKEEDIARGYNQGDQIDWVMVNGHIKAGYLWFKMELNYLFIEAIVLQEQFCGLGIGQYILELAEKKAKQANLELCRLVVMPNYRFWLCRH
ncbi:MAG: GNAT family N-acetyltransferase [Proteobacteria bacterium]|nr:GNAT family N-acetyltransferase [Pseudomonadota bacterium]